MSIGHWGHQILEQYADVAARNHLAGPKSHEKSRVPHENGVYVPICCGRLIQSPSSTSPAPARMRGHYENLPSRSKSLMFET
ncbi:hypothetical protein CY34DRAFT_798647 [Suillus luteus UH-Slu-Lm8-n1]|uniref:Uncharacterized protein n=1 Tax=Suillus luteus UH-Slu-Lm8-n1 TaxID=930992 RepID=A0A0D0B212_9AGAM|nr:hypothetical protein CY34DRAFT_798647 [Suillus luteus UH-Slu-Lm8-n1]